MITPRRIPNHVKIGLLCSGFIVLNLCLGVIYFLGVSAIQSKEKTLFQKLYPATLLLFNIDRDLYQCQLSLQTALAEESASVLQQQTIVFTENVRQSESRFRLFSSLANNLEGEEEIVENYRQLRNQWLGASQEFLGSLGSRATSQESHRLMRRSRTLFDQMRERIDQLQEEFYEPAIAEASLGLSWEKSSIRNLTIGLLFGGLLFGGFLAFGSMRSVRIQEHTIKLRDRQRALRRSQKSFESRLRRGLQMTESEEETFEIITQASAEALPETTTQILLADSSRAHLLAAGCTDGKHPGCSVGLPNDCPAIRRGERLEFETSKAFDACPHLRKRSADGLSAVCVPISVMGSYVGVVHSVAVGSRQNEEKESYLAAIAQQTGERIGLIRAFSQTRKQASTDPLTGLLNRRSFEAKIHDWNRRGIPFALAYGDLDHFKQVNDTHGHETGDRALRVFSGLLRNCVRQRDCVARWGGEEFVLAFRETSGKAVIRLLERIRTRLAKRVSDGALPPVTVSFGVCHPDQGDTLDQKLRLADEALLQAKRAGRNRIELTGTPAKELTMLEKNEQAPANRGQRKAS